MMTTHMDDRISRLLRVDRETAIAELRQLSQDNPAAFLDLLALVFDRADEASAAPPRVHFVVTQQPGSDNQT